MSEEKSEQKTKEELNTENKPEIKEEVRPEPKTESEKDTTEPENKDETGNTEQEVKPESENESEKDTADPENKEETGNAEQEVKAEASSAEPEAAESAAKSANNEPMLIEMIKNKVLPFVQKNKKQTIIGAAVIVLFIIILCAAGKPDVVSISAEYKGDTKAGVVLSGKNKDFVVTGINEKGKEVKIRGWDIDNPAILCADESSTVIIKYKELTDEVTVECSTSAAQSISADYSGSLEAGTVVNGKNITVKASLKNGESVDVSSKSVFNPESLTLEADGEYTVNITYKDPVTEEVLETSVDIECSTWSIQSIVAEYEGNTEEGTVLNEENTGIKVNAKLKNGKEKEITDWKVEKPVTLKADRTGTVKIIYKEFSCELKVECSTISEKKYKSKCKTISYDSLLRNPNKNYGEYIKLTGTIFQVVNENYWNVGFSGETPKAQFCSLGYVLRSTFLIKNSGNIYYVSIPTGKAKKRLVEGDTVTVWGEVRSLYTYENLLGASKTVPEIEAEYYS